MDNKKFSKILRRYRLGEATDAEKALVEQWYDLLDENLMDLGEVDHGLVRQRLWDRIVLVTGLMESGQTTKKGKLLSISRLGKIAVAAAAILSGILLWYNGHQMSNKKATPAEAFSLVPSGFKTHFNQDNKSINIYLSDGSVVTLAPGTKLLAPLIFDRQKREVFLEGEAFFEVTRDVTKPFYVYCGKVTTHVLGTSFNIKPVGDGQQIEVSVRTGRVEVFENIRNDGNQNSEAVNNGVVLTPNQRVLYHQESGLFESFLVNTPQPLVSEDAAESVIQRSFHFIDTPLREVLLALEQTYGIEFVVEKNSLNDCPFSGDISEQNLFQKLDILNKALGTTYEVKGTRILIKGNGCE